MVKAIVVIVFVVIACVVTSPLAVVAQQESEHSSGGRSDRVMVTNFPESWKVHGQVSIQSPLSQASMITVRDVLVTPVGPKETTRLVNAGTITTDGFTSVVLSLAGQLKNQNAKIGTVGAFLIPDEETVARAFDEQGLLLFPIEIKAATGTGTPAYFSSEQQKAVVAFPRYRVLLYNTSDKSASVTLYAYLTN